MCGDETKTAVPSMDEPDTRNTGKRLHLHLTDNLTLHNTLATLPQIPTPPTEYYLSASHSLEEGGCSPLTPQVPDDN